MAKRQTKDAVPTLTKVGDAAAAMAESAAEAATAPEAPLPAGLVELPPAADAPAGKRPCRVDVAHQPPWTGHAADEAEAVAAMKLAYGILAADHPFRVTWLDG